MPITSVDIIIVAVMLLSGLFALLRGFMRESFTVVSWIGALYVGFSAIPYLGETFRKFTSIGLLADALAFIIPFIVVLVTLSTLLNKLVKDLSGSSPGPIDGTLGFLYGLVRGFALVTLVYFGFDVFYNPEHAPDWLEDAKFRPMIEETADFYYSLVPGLRGDVAQASPSPSSTIRDDSRGEPGYSEAERDAIDQLFQSSSDD